jgi:hypothetical protein
MKKIFYAPKMEGWNDSYNHPLFEEEVFIEPQSYLSYYKEYHKKHVYWECPAWQNYYKNCFVIFSQIDIEIEYNKDTGNIKEKSFKYCIFDEGNKESAFMDVPMEFHTSPRNAVLPYNGLIIGQIKQHYVFWSKNNNKNMWMEILPPIGIEELGMEIVTAEYPFSRWYRPMLCAYKFKNEITNIKRGQPIGVVRIKNLNNYNEMFVIERKYPPEEIQRKSYNHSLMKMFLPNKSWDMIKDNKESKCPFKRFLV